MKKLQFSIDITAPKEKVWSVLWGDKTYPQWTHVFSPDSQAVTDWQEGSKVLFMDGNKDGMYSTVMKNDPNKFMSFKHLGELKAGQEMPPDEKSKSWVGSMENYALEDMGAATRLLVELDTTEETQDYFNGAFPKALEKVKELAEK